jgi:hypothetical protein
MHSHKSEYRMSTACAFCLCAGFNGKTVQKLNWSAEIFLCMRNTLRFILQCKFIILFFSCRILSTVTRIRNMNSLHGAIRKNFENFRTKSSMKWGLSETWIRRENLLIEDSCLHYEKLKWRKKETGKRKRKTINTQPRQTERNTGIRNEENKEILKYP